MASFTSFISNLSADPNKRGKQFEYFVKWFLENDPQWSTQVDRVWLWDQYPDNWGRDCGIDLVFKHKNGETWAVQAKCYSPTTQITKADVDSFISESNRDGIHKRLLVATTDLIGANAKQVCDAQVKSVVRFLLSNFEESDIEYPDTFEDLNKGKQKEKPIPKEHQIEAIEAVKKGFEEVDRGQLIMACGTGKTFTTLWIKEALQAQSTLILLPSLGLLSQTLHEWTAAKNQDFAVLCVCSDESVGKKGADEAVHDITDLAFPVTSDPFQIAAFLSQSGQKVIFSTYQSSNLIADAQSDQKIQDFDLAIADEAHRCAGDKAGNFAIILDDRRIRAKKRLFATATPRTYSTALKKGAEVRGIEIVGMDNEESFGKQLYTLNFGEAIRRSLLTDYRVVIVGVDSPMIASYIENREFLKTETGIENDAETLAAQVALLKAMKDFDLHRMISFHSRVSRAEKFSKDLNDVAGWVDKKHLPSGKLKTDFVSGEMPTFVRRQRLAILKNTQALDRTLLTNARCLSEGVDVPSLDGVAFIDPRASQVDIIQAVGRAIRLSPNKKAGTIVLPVFIRQGDNPEEVLDEGNFKPIWDVLNALKSHDDVLADELDQMRVGMGKRGLSKAEGAFSKIELDLPASVDKSFIDALQTRIVENTTASWEFMFGLLEAYVLEYRNSNVDRDYTHSSGANLGIWVKDQRQKNKKLPASRQDKLNSIPGWTWNLLDDKWESNFNQLKQYCDENGSSRVPARYVSPVGTNLGAWIGTQRKSKNDLTQERKKKLESLPGWTWNLFDEAWQSGYESLVQLVKLHGSCKLVERDDKNLKISNWIKNQRSKKIYLTKDQIAKLEAFPDWSWNTKEDYWLESYNELKKYTYENKTSAVPSYYITPNGFGLGSWTVNQRGAREKLSAEKIQLLESLKGWTWSVRDEKWEKGFNELKLYEEANESTIVTNNYVSPSGFRLGTWTKIQRLARDKLSDERRQRLESLKGWVWEKEKGRPKT